MCANCSTPRLSLRSKLRPSWNNIQDTFLIGSAMDTTEHTDLLILEVLTALTVKSVVFWYVTLWCSRMEICWRYEVSAEGYVCVFQGTLNVEEPCLSETSVKLYQTACHGGSWISVVGIAARLWAGRSGVRIPVGARDFYLFSETPRTTYSMGTWGKAAGAWSRPSNAEVNNVWSCTCTPPYVAWTRKTVPLSSLQNA